MLKLARPQQMRSGSMTLALTALLTVTPLADSAGAVNKPSWKVWELTRVTSGPTSVFPLVSAAYNESRVVLAGAFIHRRGRVNTILPGASIFSDEGRTVPQAYAQGQSVRCSMQECSTFPARGFNMLGLLYEDDGADAPNSANVLLLMAYGVEPEIEADEKGWVLREVRRRVSTVWASDGGDAMGVHSQHAGGELFLSATLPGGSRGSIALGQLPCTSVGGVSTGVGSATLTGGPQPVTMSCPTQNSGLGQAAQRAVTWRLTGPVVGTTATPGLSGPGPVRLLVVTN